MPGTSDHRPPPDDLMRSALGRAARRAGPDCLDPETLAAYYERSLDASAKARVESHVAGCLACQEALVALARSEPEPAAPAAGGWLDWLAPRLAWAAPVLVAGLAAGLWYAAQSPIAPERDVSVATSALDEQKAAAPAEAEPPAAEVERFRAEAPKAAEPVAAPAAPPPAAVAEPAAGAAAGGRPPAAREKSEEKSAERRAVTGVAASLSQVAADTAAMLVAAPGGRTIWRFGPGGAIARSDDGGSTWREQAATGGELAAGSAVSPTICWAAGRAGAVWRTTDGERWEKLAAPADADLIAVEAADADRALVTAEDGRRWETTDGGRTWSARG